MTSTCMVAASRQQPACCSGRTLPAARPRSLAAPTAARWAAAACRRGRAAAANSSAAGPAADSAPESSGESYDEDYDYGYSYDSEDGEGGARVPRSDPVKRFDFVYMNPEELAAAAAASEAAFQLGMREYAELQEWLLFRTWRFGLVFSGYLVLAASGEAAFCELIGAAAGYGYLRWLMADVSRLQPDDKIPMREAEKIKQAVPRNVAKLFAAYRQALKPRLLVLPALLGACAAWNAAFPEQQLGMVEQGCVLAGFLSWKVALALKIYEDLKPKPQTAEQLMRQQRPMLPEVEDVQLDIREIARKKAEEQQQAAAAPAATAAEGQQQQPQQ